jgi:hypothetical protein
VVGYLRTAWTVIFAAVWDAWMPSTMSSPWIEQQSEIAISTAYS